MILRAAIVGRNAALDAELALLNNGFIRIYSGAMPATPETAASGTLLAELGFAATAFAAASGGTAAANAIFQDSSANATGVAGYARLLQADGTTAMFDGDCTATGGGGFAELNSTSISAGATVQCISMSITLPM